MPATGLHYFRLKQFPNIPTVGASLSTQTQLILGDTNWPDACTELCYLGLSQHKGYRRYGVTHEDLRTVNARYHNERIRELFFRYEFDVFRPEPDGTVLFCRGVKKVFVKHAFEALKKHGLVAESTEIDLGLILHSLKQAGEGQVRGGWFGDLRIAKVDAVGIFGNDVDTSDEWERYASAGDLNAVMIELVVAGVHESFMLTRDRTVVVYRPKPESELLEFGEAVHKIVDVILASPTTPAPGTADTSAPGESGSPS